MLKRTLVILDRDQWYKDQCLIKNILANFPESQFDIINENLAAPTANTLRKIKDRLWYKNKEDSKLIGRVAQVLYGLRHPKYFCYLLNRLRSPDIVSFRCKNLKKIISKLASPDNAIIFSRSSGGRVASLVADELNIKYLICLGYPFKHPQKDVEPERYLHLEYIKTPILIIQGINDEYGGADIQEKYKLSKKVELFFVETNHSFETSIEDLKKITDKIKDWSYC